MRIAIIMTVYFVIYFSGWAVLAHMWRKAKKKVRAKMARKIDKIFRAFFIVIILILLALMIRALLPLHLTRADVIATVLY